MDFFIVKKIVATLVHVLPGVPLLIVAALLLRRLIPRLASLIALCGCLIMIALHSPPVSNVLVASLERRTSSLPVLPDDTYAVLVLGSGHIWADDRAPNARLMATALSRVTEAARLWHTRPSTVLITSGARHRSPVTHASEMAAMARELGVPAENILELDQTRDTIDEIDGAVKLLQAEEATSAAPRRLVVVSSATHLPRAALMLENAGIRYSLAPTDFLELDAPWYRLDGYFLYSADRAIHEFVGMAWYRLRYGVNS